MTITLHIERLVLEGIALDRAQSAQLRAAVEAELTRLLTSDGLSGALAQGGAVPDVPAAPIQLAADGDPGALGQQIARSVYSGINR